jgi:pimeloyl-ACP methyl ester carboxylesterase
VALAEIPGSPGAAPSPPVFVPSPINDRLWHLPFNRLQKINEQLVTGRERIFFEWEFDAAAKKLPDDVIDYYVDGLSDPESLRASFEWYRALDTTIAQDAQRAKRRLTMPVLAIGGEASFGEHVADAMKLVADDVQSVVIAGTGHFVAEESPEELLAALTAFLAPYATRTAVPA